ncbi:GGDEF domain-containing protein [Streptomyces sp. NPDC058690]|uniref:GGDEF domain-containing protein n=1 Tax=Streptomyces sp. NPDC058690 TaxID=3346600 RepID=UPI00365BDB4F
MIVSHDAAVLNPQKVKQGRRQRHTEHTLGLSHHLVRQRLLDTVITVIPERRPDFVESRHGTHPTAQSRWLRLQDHFLVRRNDFKKLNDSHGHAAGDFALAVTAGRLAAWCGRHGIAGRFGGDEFVAIARQAMDLESLRRALSQPVAYAGRRLPVSVSVGSCQVKDLPVRSLSDALTAADSAMYADKGKAGRRGTRPLSR